MKKVISISLDGKFHQYLKLSEIKVVNQWMEMGYTVTCVLVKITNEEYKKVFGI